MISNIKNEKAKLRKKQFQIRKNLFLNNKKVFNRDLFEDFFQNKNLNIISSFISINTEINTNELNNYLLKKKKILCFPTIVNTHDRLLFREFKINQKMINGYMNIKEPPKANKILVPELLFIPCLAFDKSGFRLGYGGGYYDKTLSYLKKNKSKFISAGYAFDDQKVSEVPKDKFDIKLDYVITEKNIYPFV